MRVHGQPGQLDAPSRRRPQEIAGARTRGVGHSGQMKPPKWNDTKAMLAWLNEQLDARREAIARAASAQLRPREGMARNHPGADRGMGSRRKLGLQPADCNSSRRGKLRPDFSNLSQRKSSGAASPGGKRPRSAGIAHPRSSEKRYP
jgi:hypothetical protein